MDPFTLMMGASALAGVGMQAFGAIGGASSAKQAAGISSNIAGLEQKVNQQRRTAMEIAARRQQLEAIRNTQRAHAMALTNATNQGAQKGSGLAGGLAEVTDQGNFNLGGINQNLAIGRNIFGFDDQISQQKMQLAQVQGQSATYAGISQLGSGLTQSAGALGRLSGGFGGFGNPVFSSSFGLNNG